VTIALSWWTFYLSQDSFNNYKFNQLNFTILSM
jgi:hypothetical protein